MEVISMINFTVTDTDENMNVKGEVYATPNAMEAVIKQLIKNLATATEQSVPDVLLGITISLMVDDMSTEGDEDGKN